jgi:hypothetical protein
MSEINLTQIEADLLITMEKHCVEEQAMDFNSLGGSSTVPLISADKREHFFLDLSRGRIDLNKGKYQNRARQVVVLLRLEFGGSPHRNPDGKDIPSPHLHIYKEGFGDKWAIEPPKDKFSNITDSWKTLDEFMRFCNITKPPKFI